VQRVFLRRYASSRFRCPLDVRAVFFRSRSNEFNVAPAIEDSLDFMNETICHLAPLIHYMFMSSMDVELMAKICG
jgi:hypothetical protein